MAVDEGNLNNSKGNSDFDGEGDETPFDSQSEKNSQDDILKLEYEKLKEKFDKIKSDKKSKQ